MSKTESRKLSDDYEVAGVLGRGGFSIVRKGVSKSEGRTEVAIKTLRRLGPAMMGPPLQQGSKAGLPMWKQVSISDALLTNEILVMRRIVESVPIWRANCQCPDPEVRIPTSKCCVFSRPR